MKSTEFESIIEYMQESLEEGQTDIKSIIADYFDFQNRTIKVSKSEKDWIKYNLTKKSQIEIFGKVIK
jgi:uncharacterized protein YdeI (BOF family)